MNGRSKALLIAGAITLAATVAVLTLHIQDWNRLIIIAVCFLIWAELFFFGGFLAVEKMAGKVEPLLLRSSFGVVLTAYTGLSVLLSFFCIFFSWPSQVLFLVLQLFLLAATAILLVVFYTSAKGAHRTNTDSELLLKQFSAYSTRMAVLATSVPQEFSTSFAKLADDLRFCDTHSSAPVVEEEIRHTISQLELAFSPGAAPPAHEWLEEKQAELSALIASRRIEVGSRKKGGF